MQMQVSVIFLLYNHGIDGHQCYRCHHPCRPPPRPPVSIATRPPPPLSSDHRPTCISHHQHRQIFHMHLSQACSHCQEHRAYVGFYLLPPLLDSSCDGHVQQLALRTQPGMPMEGISTRGAASASDLTVERFPRNIPGMMSATSGLKVMDTWRAFVNWRWNPETRFMNLEVSLDTGLLLMNVVVLMKR